MILENLILHRVDKIEVNKSNKFVPRFRGEELQITSVTNDFAERLNKSFSRSRPTRGVFDDSKGYNAFQSALIEPFLNGDISFIEFSKKATGELADKIPLQAEGGILVFMNFISSDSTQFLTIAMLEHSTQYKENVDLSIEALETLATEKLARAVKIDVMDYQGTDLDTQYLSFIKGTRSISKFFQKFVGATDLKSAAKNVKILHDTVVDYCTDLGLTPRETDDVKMRIKEYLENVRRENEEVSLSVVGGLIDQNNSDGFEEYIQEHDLEVSDRFIIDKPSDNGPFKRSVVTVASGSVKLDFSVEGKEYISRYSEDSLVVSGIDPEWIEREFGGGEENIV